MTVAEPEHSTDGSDKPDQYHCSLSGEPIKIAGSAAADRTSHLLQINRTGSGSGHTGRDTVQD